MSDKELNRFLSDLESTPALHQALQSLAHGGEHGARVPAEQIVAFARERGYTFDLEDLTADIGELDESELDAVVGGAGNLATSVGGTVNSNHGKWIDVLSVDWGAHRRS